MTKFWPMIQRPRDSGKSSALQTGAVLYCSLHSFSFWPRMWKPWLTVHRHLLTLEVNMRVKAYVLLGKLYFQATVIGFGVFSQIHSSGIMKRKRRNLASL